MNTISRILNLIRYGNPGRRPRTPILVIFHITTRCNMACRHCGDDVWGNPNDDLSLGDIEKFCNGLGHTDSVSLGGGEPFLRKDLADICALFHERNGARSISIPSNGFATQSICVTVKEILEKCPGAALHMMLSLDGFQETHDNMRTPGSFAKVIETGHRLTEMKKENPRLTLCFNSTITGNNWQELPKLAAFVRNTFKANLEFNILTGNPRDSECKVPAPSQLEQTMDAIYAVHDVTPLTLSHHHIYRDVVLKTNLEKRQIVPCRAGSLVCMVDANGDVRACPLLPPLGNLRAKSFQSIWHSATAKQQYQSICKGECTCNNDCFIRISLMNYWKLPFYMLQKRFKSQ